MARETKVGLLAGLAFVICFAVILANRGGENTAHGTMSNYSAVDVPSSIQRNAARNSNPAHVNESSRRAGSDPRNAKAPPRNSAPARNPNLVTGEALAPSNGAELVFDTQHGGSSLTLPFNSNTRPTTGSMQIPADRADANATRRPADVGLEVPNRGTAMDARAANNQPAFAPVPKPEPSNIGQVSAIQAKLSDYTVESGDTLSKIAIKQYGAKSKAAIQAIFDANRNALSSPDAVRAGMTLVIPRLGPLAAAQGNTPGVQTSSREISQSKAPKGAATDAVAPAPNGKPGSSAPEKHGTAEHDKLSDVVPPPAQGRGKPDSRKSVESTSTDKFRWYQVKKNDRYVSIARDQLGNGERWHEIYELNKDKFADPQQIREGVRIKLPAAAGASLEATH
ncbi:MAG: LysM peptidoglycan-binding domain-containing protein [Planctomycetes bacterium]|nr:LysM peptidoglycan-binding domain-containing protein [Planctomycetota bacterium]MBI3833859.1 LysM peptidoglycan-binding domain-containing protein [Planctomycetota bacterium]